MISTNQGRILEFEVNEEYRSQLLHLETSGALTQAHQSSHKAEHCRSLTLMSLKPSTNNPVHEPPLQSGIGSCWLHGVLMVGLSCVIRSWGGWIESLVNQDLVPDSPHSAASCHSPQGHMVQSQGCICHVKRPSNQIFAFCVWYILQASFTFNRWKVRS